VKKLTLCFFLFLGCGSDNPSTPPPVKNHYTESMLLLLSQACINNSISDAGCTCMIDNLEETYTEDELNTILYKGEIQKLLDAWQGCPN